MHERKKKEGLFSFSSENIETILADMPFKTLSFFADERKKKRWLLCWEEMTHAIKKNTQHFAGIQQLMLAVSP